MSKAGGRSGAAVGYGGRGAAEGAGGEAAGGGAGSCGRTRQAPRGEPLASLFWLAANLSRHPFPSGLVGTRFALLRCADRCGISVSLMGSSRRFAVQVVLVDLVQDDGGKGGADLHRRAVV
jgi:hypothetical protein